MSGRDADLIRANLMMLAKQKNVSRNDISATAKVPLSVIDKLFEGNHGAVRVDSLSKIACALDVDISELVARR